MLALIVSAALFTFAAGAEDVPFCNFSGKGISGRVTGEAGGLWLYITEGSGEIPDYIKSGELSDMLSPEPDQPFFKAYLESLGDVYIPVKFIEINGTSKTAGSVSVSVNGAPVFFDRIPQIENGRILLPLRGVFEALGAKVDWDGSTGTVTAERNGTTLSLTVGSDRMTVNENTAALEVPAKLFGGRTFIPMRAVGEAFGLNVNWDDYLREASVFSE